MKSNDERLLPGGTDWHPWLLSDAELLAAASEAREQLDRAHARWLRVVAEVERRQASLHETAMPTASWLASGRTHSARAARAEVRLAELLTRTPHVTDALAEGRLSVEQASTIVHGLEELPDDLDAAQRAAVSAHLVELGREFNPAALRQLVNKAVETVAPEALEHYLGDKLEREERSQQRSRYLTFRTDHDGGLLLSGKLPAADGALVKRHLYAIASSLRVSDAALGVDTTQSAALADALMQAVTHHARCERGPVQGGDTTRLVITMGLTELRDGLGRGALLDSGHHLPAGQVRRMACDAHVLPVVLDGASQPIDVGREHRLFTPAQRVALTVRDQGCAFPGCDRPPADCEAHHITSWWSGGPSDLANGVLLCGHHHHLIEPNPRRPEHENWKIAFDARGRPTFTTPARPSGQRITKQHHRYRT